MKKILSVVVFIAMSVTAYGQDTQMPKFGYFSYDKVLKSMDGYIMAKHNVDQLRSQYDAEAKRSEDDFNAKYESFVEEQAGLASTIRNKRQAELMDLMEKNRAFKEGAQRLISEAERSATDSLCTLIDNAAREVGSERGYAFIVNTDSHSLPFVNPLYGEDATAAIEDKLSKR